MKRRRRNGNILIDLTSLLDIVFIVLLVVICQLQNIKQNTVQAEEKAEKDIQQVQAAKELYDDQIESFEKVSNYIVFISVNSHYDENQITTRHIDILCSDKEVEVPVISDLHGMNVEKGYGELENFIRNYISNNESKTIVLSLNEGDDDILYRDEKKIKNMFNSFCSEFRNVKEKE